MSGLNKHQHLLIQPQVSNIAITPYLLFFLLTIRLSEEGDFGHSEFGWEIGKI